MRMRRKPELALKLIENTTHLVQSPEGLRGVWQERFGNNRPLHLELGTGKGSFLTEMAVSYPNINFIGLERVPEVLFHAVNRAGLRANLQFILGDVNDLPLYFGEGEIERIYLNFSDPWPKNRHSKRRLTHPEYLASYKKLLKKGGDVQLKTDNVALFCFSLEAFSTSGFSLAKITKNLHQTVGQHNVETEYETKFSAMGVPICRCVAFTPYLG